MFELGTWARNSTGAWGSAPALGNIDACWPWGELAWNIYDAAHQSGITQALYARDRTAAKELLPNLVRPGAVILVKASRGMAFEELTPGNPAPGPPRHKRPGPERPGQTQGKFCSFPRSLGKNLSH